MRHFGGSPARALHRNCTYLAPKQHGQHGQPRTTPRHTARIGSGRNGVMTTRHGFGAKVAAIITLIALADTLAFDGWGVIPGNFAVAWSIVLLVTVKPFRHRAGLAASIAAVSFA